MNPNRLMTEAPNFLPEIVVGIGSAAGTVGIIALAVKGKLGDWLDARYQTRGDAAARREAHEKDVESLRTSLDAEFRKVDRTMEGLDRRVADNTTGVSRAEGKVSVLAERVAGQGDRLTEMHDAVRAMDGKLDGMGKGQAAIAEAVKGLGHSLDQLRNEMRGGR